MNRISSRRGSGAPISDGTRVLRDGGDELFGRERAPEHLVLRRHVDLRLDLGRVDLFGEGDPVRATDFHLRVFLKIAADCASFRGLFAQAAASRMTAANFFTTSALAAIQSAFANNAPIIHSRPSASKGIERTRVRPRASAVVASGSAIRAASTRPAASAGSISVNGSSTNLIVDESPPFLSTQSWMESCVIFLRPLHATVFPLRSFAFLIGEFLATRKYDVGFFALKSPAPAMILNERPRS